MDKYTIIRDWKYCDVCKAVRLTHPDLTDTDIEHSHLQYHIPAELKEMGL